MFIKIFHTKSIENEVISFVIVLYLDPEETIFLALLRNPRMPHTDNTLYNYLTATNHINADFLLPNSKDFSPFLWEIYNLK